VQQYLLSIDPPKYPFAIDAKLAELGRGHFQDHCAKCHGSYGDKPTYPNKIIPIDEIGTDPNRFRNIGEKYHAAYAKSWFGKEEPIGKPLTKSVGYQAPPLDGIWATAPYFHNGSVPTLDGVLNSKSRPKRFTRSFKTGECEYDKDRVGWIVTETDAKPANAYDRRKIYDTSRPGHSNRGHTYGDDLTAAERRAIVEYLKTL
jgi:cytochrome c peroxidase